VPARSPYEIARADARGLADRLGRSGRLEARLASSIVDGALHLDSTGVSVRLFGRRVPVPRGLAPRVHLTESFDDQVQQQRVRVTVSVPGLGIVYEYAGAFRYSIESGEPPA
jgi:hypothetical protein